MIGAEKICLETDNLGVAQALQFNDRDRSHFGPLIEEIKELLKGVDDHLVIWSRRLTNKASHNVAREGCMKKLCKT